jgi:hypothetical protein
VRTWELVLRWVLASNKHCQWLGMMSCPVQDTCVRMHKDGPDGPALDEPIELKAVHALRVAKAALAWRSERMLCASHPCLFADCGYIFGVVSCAALHGPLLCLGLSYLLCRQVAVWAVFWLLVVFYAPIVAAIQAPVNMDNLRKVSHSALEVGGIQETTVWLQAPTSILRHPASLRHVTFDLSLGGSGQRRCPRCSPSTNRPGCCYKGWTGASRLLGSQHTTVGPLSCSTP